MVSANFTPYNVPAGTYNGHLGELSIPTTFQHFQSCVELAKGNPLIAPTNAIEGYIQRFNDKTPISADDANLALTKARAQKYTHTITQGELSQKINQINNDVENIRAIKSYRQNNYLSVTQVQLINIGANFVAFVTDPFWLIFSAIIITIVMDSIKKKVNS